MVKTFNDKFLLIYGRWAAYILERVWLFHFLMYIQKYIISCQGHAYKLWILYSIHCSLVHKLLTLVTISLLVPSLKHIVATTILMQVVYTVTFCQHNNILFRSALHTTCTLHHTKNDAYYTEFVLMFLSWFSLKC